MFQLFVLFPACPGLTLHICLNVVSASHLSVIAPSNLKSFLHSSLIFTPTLVCTQSSPLCLPCASALLQYTQVVFQQLHEPELELSCWSWPGQLPEPKQSWLTN
jgi:hypothetical protein